MTTDDIVIAATTRTALGKADVKRLRKEGKLPGVIYGSGKPATSVEVDAHTFTLMLNKHASDNIMVDLALDGGVANKVLLKEVQRHPVSQRLMHADFNAVSLTETIKVEISLEYTGTPVGVSQGGGTLDAHIRSIEVECLPQDVIEQFEVDVSALEIGDHLVVSDISLDSEKYTLVTDGDISIASVAAPRVAEEDEETEEEVAEGSEPEVITEKKEEEAES